MFKNQFCPISQGVNLLNKNTNTAWRALLPEALFPNMCVATILPANTAHSNLYPILDQPGYIPHNLNSTTTPERFHQYLRTNSQQILKIIPSVKYGLDGIKIKMIETVAMTAPLPGWYVIEGIISLIGDIIVKPTSGMNPLGLSVNDKTGRITLNSAIQAKDDFIASLKIKGFVPIKNSSLTISSSSTDKISMTSTDIQLTLEGNSQKIIATFAPAYYEIENQFGLTLEIRMGYKFVGKATYYPSPPDQKKQYAEITHSLGKGLLVGSATIGIVILCVFAAPEIIATSAVVAAGSLLLTRG